ncbi:MAG: VanZ family protein [Bacteroidales bacterium]
MKFNRNTKNASSIYWKIMYKRIISTLFWAYFLVLITVSIIPWSTSERIGAGSFEIRLDYLLHIGAYFGWALLYITFRYEKMNRKNRPDILFHLIIGILFSFSTELIQWFLPYRSFNLLDFSANVAGILLTYTLYLVFYNRITLAISKVKLR